jgi:hypothetical protein
VAGASNQDNYCEGDDDCGNTEVCLSLGERTSTICLSLCRTDSDCQALGDYHCKLDYPMAVRGQTWGGCTRTPPPQWSCDAILYAGWIGGQDTLCDCFCGAFDPDCPDNDTETNCETCGNGKLCVPNGWTCSDTQWHDDDCDCGCGAIDHNCEDAGNICDQCPPKSCADEQEESCGDIIRPDDNAHCKEIPDGWRCAVAAYFDGKTCDCGCNVLDPDCDGDPRDTICKRCPDGSCGQSDGHFEACSEDILVDMDNSQCVPGVDVDTQD